MDKPVGMILSAGFGTRLYPLTAFRPKPVMEVGGKPIIHFLVKKLERAGVKDIVINLHHRPNHIVYALSESSARIHFIHERSILGTAGGIANAMRTLAIHRRPLLLVHGDILCDFDLGELAFDDLCTLVCDKDRLVSGYSGNVGIDARGNIVELGRFYSRGEPSALRGFFTGVHALSKHAVKMVTDCDLQSLVAEVYPAWLRRGLTIKGIVRSMCYEDLGSPGRLFHANMSLLKNPSVLEEIADGKLSLGQSIFLSPTASIHRDATIEGPVLIDDGARVGNAKIGPNVVVGKHAHVGDGAVIKNSVVMSDTIVQKNEIVDCMIGLSSVRVLVTRGN